MHYLLRRETFIKLEMKIIANPYPGCGGLVVVVKDNQVWLPFESYLQKLPPPASKRTAKADVQLQRHWWRSMKKPFRFLELPVELQKRIFLLAIGERVAPQTGYWDSNVYDYSFGRRADEESTMRLGYTCLTGGATRDQHSVSSAYYDCTAPTLPPVNLRLLSLSKASRETALAVLWEDTVKTYVTISQLILPTHPAVYLQFLRRVEVAFTNSDYLSFFGVDLPHLNNRSHCYKALDSKDPAPPAAYFQTLPNLHCLELFFRSTATDSASPWYHGNFVAQPPIGAVYYPFPCQKTLVEWIMCFAYKHVKHIKSVRLTGYVKAATKKKWEGVLNGGGGLYYDQLTEAEKALILRLNAMQV